jgi:hypothetical protein
MHIDHWYIKSWQLINLVRLEFTAGKIIVWFQKIICFFVCIKVYLLLTSAKILQMFCKILLLTSLLVFLLTFLKNFTFYQDSKLFFFTHSPWTGKIEPLSLEQLASLNECSLLQIYFLHSFC